MLITHGLQEIKLLYQQSSVHKVRLYITSFVS